MVSTFDQLAIKIFGTILVKIFFAMALFRQKRTSVSLFICSGLPSALSLSLSLSLSRTHTRSQAHTVFVKCTHTLFLCANNSKGTNTMSMLSVYKRQGGWKIGVNPFLWTSRSYSLVQKLNDENFSNIFGLCNIFFLLFGDFTPMEMKFVDRRLLLLPLSQKSLSQPSLWLFVSPRRSLDRLEVMQ